MKGNPPNDAQRTAEKSNSLKLFAVFSAAAMHKTLQVVRCSHVHNYQVVTEYF